MKTKRDKNYSRGHTLQRLRERYNLDLTFADYDQLCELAQTQGCIIGWEPDMDQEIIDVKFDGTMIRVVWDTKNEIVRTVLPL